jgi:hypothetical protein
VLNLCRGQGGGKTHVLEEMRRELLLKEGVLCIGVTYNSDTTIDEDRETWTDAKKPYSKYSLSLISRMASSFFGISFKTSFSVISKYGLVKVADQHDEQEMIREFIVYMVSRLRAAGRPVDTFVLLVDEVVKFQEYMESKFSNVDDITSVVRNAVLNEPLREASGTLINAALVLSTLEISPIGQTSSGRAVEMMVLSESLNISDVVHSIWNITRAEDEDTACLLAALTCQIPRLMEMVLKHVSALDRVI